MKEKLYTWEEEKTGTALDYRAPKGRLRFWWELIKKLLSRLQ